MALAAPKLDDRRFQDLVDEAKKRIPHHVKEWTDHNVSDPGVTLIELFAWMTDVILYRLNQVPDKHYIKFMDMFGIRLQEPVPASVPVTFWLSAPQPTAVVIPAGTEVASTQTETERSIVFTTDKDLPVRPPTLSTALSRVAKKEGGGKEYQTHNLRRLAAGFEGLDTFSSVPQVDDALYFGFDEDLSQHILGFEMDFDSAGGAGIDPTLPPYVWEASTGNEDVRWQLCDVDMDTTNGMNSAGRIRIHVPDMGQNSVNRKKAYWVRVRVREIHAAEQREGMRPFKSSPRLRQVSCATWGGTTKATHAEHYEREFLGQSDGTPGQRLRLQVRPVLRRKPGETLLVQAEGAELQTWQEVDDFADSGATDPHFTLDSVSGEIRLGPAVRQPDGTIKLYGDIPPRGANLIFQRYRSGGGQVGNVQAGILNTLKTAIPFIARVTNREAAWGGLDAETLESAMVRAPKTLRHRQRAVTADDFEDIARETPGVNLGRVKCLQPRPSEAGRVAPGQVYLLVIPRVANPNGYLEPSQLDPAEGDVATLTDYLDERRLLTTRLEVQPPAYRWVSVRAQLRADPGANQDEVQAEVLARLYRFINPLSGGRDGKGWPFGRELFLSDVYQSLQGMERVQFVRNVEMYVTTPGGEPQGDPVDSVDVVAHGVVASGIHEVEFI